MRLRMPLIQRYWWTRKRACCIGRPVTWLTPRALTKVNATGRWYHDLYSVNPVVWVQSNPNWS